MKISTIIPTLNSLSRGDTFIEAIKSHLCFSDELIIVDGESKDGTIEAIKALQDNRIKIVQLYWPENWDWVEYALHANLGFKHATGDWVIDGETDHIWKETDAKLVIKTLEQYSSSKYPLLEVERVQVTTVDRMFIKAKIPCFINKKYFGDKIGYGIDQNQLSDLGKPIFIQSKISEYLYEGTLVPPVGVPLQLYNYLYPFKNWDQIVKERIKAFTAWNKCKYLKKWNRNLPEAYEEVDQYCKNLVLSKHSRTRLFPLEKHPVIMLDRIRQELMPGMFGYDMCGLIKGYKPEGL